jgi:hypothetical protein
MMTDMLEVTAETASHRKKPGLPRHPTGHPNMAYTPKDTP